jgi:hypothetical protein
MGLAFRRQLLLLGLVQGAQAAGAHMDASSRFSVLNGDGLDVRHPAAIGGPLGMAHIVANL